MTEVSTTAASASKLSLGRKAFALFAAAAVIGVAMAPADASAKGRHYGYGAAAITGGLILGAIAANSAYADDGYGYDEPRCWTEKRVRYGAYGERFVQKVRVCD